MKQKETHKKEHNRRKPNGRKNYQRKGDPAEMPGLLLR